MGAVEGVDVRRDAGLRRLAQLYGGSLQPAVRTDDRSTVVLEIPAAGTRRVTA
ncbi:MAG TPA: hypothetical protein VFL94_13245 [Actinomycetales bacterium]|jgi:hypothetical protein|nr:hypothetical protein [Actinomycetales bacterium]